MTWREMVGALPASLGFPEGFRALEPGLTVQGLMARAEAGLVEFALLAAEAGLTIAPEPFYVCAIAVRDGWRYESFSHRGAVLAEALAGALRDPHWRRQEPCRSHEVTLEVLLGILHPRPPRPGQRLLVSARLAREGGEP